MTTFGIQTLLEHAAVCSRLMANTNNPDQWQTLERLREVWKALATHGEIFTDAELVQYVEALSSVQATIVTKIIPTMH